MEYKLLAVSSFNEVNIGDYIQALAASQFLPDRNGFVEREELKSYTGKPCKIIMNGWFMHNPEEWPPAPQISPLFIAFHINSLAQAQLLSRQSLDYLKMHEPIGCRDTATADMLVKEGIKAYFSGCLTLTLGYKYKAAQRDGNIYFVDPYFVTNWTITTTIKSAVYLFLHWKAINTIARKHPEQKTGLRKRFILANFYKQYVRVFTKSVLLNATYICQQNTDYRKKFATDEALLNEAERLVQLYAKATLVVTSRIHCALPCLGLNTPVIYTENSSQSEASRCRLGGLRELFNVMLWKDGKLQPEFPLNGKISSTDNIPVNKQKWMPLAENIKECIEKWIRQTSAKH
ncbi:MAG: polysaccharide pyruvyl transferase family protein [Bacteroidaceae bacterium]|nr:polysaccharide pyruvyl transferase family protein [Bacteroidaceae bacterium]